MARNKSTFDVTTLQMALVGYQVQRQKIEQTIREIQSQLKGKGIPATATAAVPGSTARRQLSPAARKRISAAQKKRWAEHRRLASQSRNGA